LREKRSLLFLFVIFEELETSWCFDNFPRMKKSNSFDSILKTNYQKCRLKLPGDLKLSGELLCPFIPCPKITKGPPATFLWMAISNIKAREKDFHKKGKG